MHSRNYITNAKHAALNILWTYVEIKVSKIKNWSVMAGDSQGWPKGVVTNASYSAVTGNILRACRSKGVGCRIVTWFYSLDTSNLAQAVNRDLMKVY